MIKEEFETVLVEGKFELLRARRLTNEVIQGYKLPEYHYHLVDCNSKQILLKIHLISSSEAELCKKNWLVIRNVESTKPGRINFFPRTIEMIRKDLRKENPKADIIATYPFQKMKQYYKKRLGARKDNAMGVIRFPQNLTKRKRLKRV